MVRVAIGVEQNWNSVPGGTARSTNRLIEALLGETDVEVSGLHGSHRSGPVLELPEHLRTRTIPIPGRLLQQTWNAFGRPSVDRWLDHDVVHGPAYVVPPSSLPSVVTIHDLAFIHEPAWFTRHGVRFFNRFLDRVIDSESAVIVPSKVTASDCVDAGIDEDRLHVIPWGVAPSSTTPSEVDDVRGRFDLPERFVLFVGTLEPRKNLDTLQRAMSAIPDVPLVIAGPVGWGDVPVADAIVLGSLADRDVSAVMAAAEILAYPSRYEGFGLPVVEAMAEGTPVIVTEGTAAAEVAGGGGRAVRTERPEPLTEALRELLGSDDQRRRLSLAGRARAAEFPWAETARATAAVYAGLAAS